MTDLRGGPDTVHVAQWVLMNIMEPGPQPTPVVPECGSTRSLLTAEPGQRAPNRSRQLATVVLRLTADIAEQLTAG